MKISIEQREAAKRRIDELAAAHNGTVTPDMVVADAESADSPLHELFEWDDEKAAAQHRLYQARELIRSITVVFVDETTTVQSVGYIRDPRVRSGFQGYVSVATIRTEEDASRAALISEFQRIAALLSRAKLLAVALGMAEELSAIELSVTGLRRRLDPPAAVQ